MTIKFKPVDSFRITAAEYAYNRGGVTQESKHRLSKDIAQELRDQHGEGAYLHCVEKLSNGSPNAKLWRDVLSWLDETKGEIKCED